MSYDGKEKRSLDKDWVERDRLLTEVSENTKYIKQTISLQKDAFDKYVSEDKEEHHQIKKRVFWLTIAVVIIGVVLGGPSFALMFVK